MNMLFQISILLLFITSGCGLFDADPKPLAPIETFFLAEINGEAFNANYANTGIETGRGQDFLEFSGSYKSEDLFPYGESIGFSLIYNEEFIRYPLNIDTVLTEVMGFKVPVSSYNEVDGDVVISRYLIPEDSDGFIMVELNELEDGRKTISGTFEMTVYLSFRIDTDFPQQEQDTLHITNGRYLLELNDKRD